MGPLGTDWYGGKNGRREPATARDRENGFVRYYKVSTKSEDVFSLTGNIKKKVSQKILKDYSKYGTEKNG